MVYDASKSGLNKALWATNFSLPTKEDMLNGVSPISWMGDLNVGEMFLSFSRHANVPWKQ